MEWYLYDNGLRHEKVKLGQFSLAEALKTIMWVLAFYLLKKSGDVLYSGNLLKCLYFQHLVIDDSFSSTKIPSYFFEDCIIFKIVIQFWQPFFTTRVIIWQSFMRFFKEQTYLRICLHHSNRWNFEIRFFFRENLLFLNPRNERIVARLQDHHQVSRIQVSVTLSCLYDSVSFFVVLVATNIVIRFFFLYFQFQERERYHRRRFGVFIVTLNIFRTLF